MSWQIGAVKWSSLLKTVTASGQVSTWRTLTSTSRGQGTPYLPYRNWNPVWWCQVLFAPVHEQQLHGARIGRRELTTFYTHRRLNRFKRLHLRVNSAVEIFIEEVCKVVSLEPNAISIYDDILIFGATQEKHVSYNCGGVTDWPWTWIVRRESGQPMFGDILYQNVFWWRNPAGP